jgi:hypothetical protein
LAPEAGEGAALDGPSALKFRANHRVLDSNGRALFCRETPRRIEAIANQRLCC